MQSSQQLPTDLEASKKDTERQKFDKNFLIAAQGDAEAQNYIGDCYRYGMGVAIDDKAAAHWYQLAATQGDSYAQVNLGFCYEQGLGVIANHKEAAHYYQLAADQGDMNAQFNLGACYDLGRGVSKDDKKAVDYYQLAAHQGHAGAQSNLGMCYETGRGVPKKNYKVAVRYYQTAADQGHVEGQVNLGTCYEKSRGVPQDYKKAVYYYRLAADKGYAIAQANLGTCYEKGLGVMQDYNEAVRFYRLAAAQGYAGAQVNLGICYARAWGVTENHEEAARYFQLAADQGNVDAQLNLALCYHSGEVGVVKDLNKAIHYYQLAASQGHPTAQYFLGVFFEDKEIEEIEGFEQDLEKAAYYYRLAAAQGNQEALTALNKLAEEAKQGNMEKDVTTAITYHLALVTKNPKKTVDLTPLIEANLSKFVALVQDHPDDFKFVHAYANPKSVKKIKEGLFEMAALSLYLLQDGLQNYSCSLVIFDYVFSGKLLQDSDFSDVSHKHSDDDNSTLCHALEMHDSRLMRSFMQLGAVVGPAEKKAFVSAVQKDGFIIELIKTEHPILNELDKQTIESIHVKLDRSSLLHQCPNHEKEIKQFLGGRQSLFCNMVQLAILFKKTSLIKTWSQQNVSWDDKSLKLAKTLKFTAPFPNKQTAEKHPKTKTMDGLEHQIKIDLLYVTAEKYFREAMDFKGDAADKETMLKTAQEELKKSSQEIAAIALLLPKTTESSDPDIQATNLKIQQETVQKELQKLTKKPKSIKKMIVAKKSLPAPADDKKYGEAFAPFFEGSLVNFNHLKTLLAFMLMLEKFEQGIDFDLSGGFMLRFGLFLWEQEIAEEKHRPANAAIWKAAKIKDIDHHVLSDDEKTLKQSYDLILKENYTIKPRSGKGSIKDGSFVRQGFKKIFDGVPFDLSLASSTAQRCNLPITPFAQAKGRFVRTPSRFALPVDCNYYLKLEAPAEFRQSIDALILHSTLSVYPISTKQTNAIRFASKYLDKCVQIGKAAGKTLTLDIIEQKRQPFTGSIKDQVKTYYFSIFKQGLQDDKKPYCHWIADVIINRLFLDMEKNPFLLIITEAFFAAWINILMHSISNNIQKEVCKDLIKELKHVYRDLPEKVSKSQIATHIEKSTRLFCNRRTQKLSCPQTVYPPKLKK